jgi:hypothetical protein
VLIVSMPTPQHRPRNRLEQMGKSSEERISARRSWNLFLVVAPKMLGGRALPPLNHKLEGGHGVKTIRNLSVVSDIKKELYCG